MDKHIQQEDAEGFTVVSLDESFFFYDSFVRRCGLNEIIDR
ncbi:MAG: hypothetical protein ABJB76_02550 [Candidatus Nitrosocosmicus sp.]